MAKLDFNSINKRIVAYTDIQTALKDIPPMEWEPEVLSGEKTVIVSSAKMEKDGCVKLEISLS